MDMEYGPWGEACLGLHPCMRRRLDPWSMTLLQEITTKRWQDKMTSHMAEAEAHAARYLPARRKQCTPLDEIPPSPSAARMGPTSPSESGDTTTTSRTTTTTSRTT